MSRPLATPVLRWSLWLACLHLAPWVCHGQTQSIAGRFMVSLETGQEEVLFEVRRVDGAFSSGIYRFSTGLWEMQSARYTVQGTLAGFEVWTSLGHLDFDLAGLRLTDGFGSNWPIGDIHQTVGPDVAAHPRHLRVEKTASGLCLRWDGTVGNHHEILTKD
ncbi:MAG: hypothetical protein P8L18_03875, partial [Verrucomicrobiota bacterium]|nr:hypothetical protein [Verrucomicrobiota bacterium]